MFLHKNLITKPNVNLEMWSLGIYWASFGVFLPVISTFAVGIITLYAFKWMTGDSSVPIRDFSKTHSWKSIQVTTKRWRCSVCEVLLHTGIGVYCDCCGVCADPSCVKKADKNLPCKVISTKNEEFEHHWVKGNLSLGSICETCGDDCDADMDDSVGLNDYQCCWCHKTVHTNCLVKTGKICDLGPYKTLIVPPWSVQVARKRNIHRNFLLQSIRDPGWDDWTPLIVVANRKAGNNDGAIVLSEFRAVLNPAQVLDLSDRNPAAALQWSLLVAPRKVKFLVAGGDGTIAWILSTAHKMSINPPPSIAILPLGTGNDLSRVLGWGKENEPELDVHKLLYNIQTAEMDTLDRWQVDIIPHRHMGLRFPARTLYMYNYLSIGVDAQVTLDFHKTRESRFYVFRNRIFNKLLYLCFGTQQVVAAGCRNLERRLEVLLDGKKIDLPELESVVILNIPSWGAGVNLWGMDGEGEKQSYNDGILEVVGIYSSFHIAQLQVGLSTPHRLGQAKVIEINLSGSTAVQADGEPWEQHPAHFRISLVDRASVLLCDNY